MLRALRSCEATGIAGEACRDAGARLVAHVRDVSGMGIAELVPRAPAIAAALGRLLREAVRGRHDVAILASWSAANARIGRLLRRIGVPVCWISPPEVWAWGAYRARSVARAADLLVPTLPFEEAIFTKAGGHARYVGHPALDVVLPDRTALRAALGLHDRPAVAILPGSRAGEVDRLIGPFVSAGRLSRGVSEARLVVAPSLPAGTRARATARAILAGIPCVDAPPDGAGALLSAFDASIVSSGTASLEAALAGAPPVVAYRMHSLTAAIARRVVRSPWIALPNVILGRAAFPERLQDDVTPRALVEALGSVLGNAEARAACDEVRAVLSRSLDRQSCWAERVARLVERVARPSERPRHPLGGSMEAR